MATLSKLEIGKAVGVKVSFRNSGRSAALNVTTVCLRGYGPPENDPQDPHGDGLDAGAPVYAVMLPNQTREMNLIARDVFVLKDQETLDAINNDGIMIWVSCKIEYSDTSSQKHRTFWSEHYAAQLGMFVSSKKGNEAD